MEGSKHHPIVAIDDLDANLFQVVYANKGHTKRERNIIMGFVKKAFKVLSPIAAITGLGEEKSSTPAPANDTAAENQTAKSVSEIQAEEDAKKKAALIASNAGRSPNATLGSSPVNVTKKTLLGL